MSTSSRSLGSYSLGKQPAKVLQPVVIGQTRENGDLNSTFQGGSTADNLNNTQGDTHIADINLELKPNAQPPNRHFSQMDPRFEYAS